MNNFVLIFVCTGNICRSPMAEGIMKEMVLDEFVMNRQVMPVEILSAGTHAPIGSSVSRFALEVADKHGINLRFHRSKQVTEQIVNAADLILTMEENHTEYIRQHWPGVDYVFELKRFGRNDSATEDSPDINDPIGMGIEVYIRVFDELQSEIARVSKTIYSLVLDKYRVK